MMNPIVFSHAFESCKEHMVILNQTCFEWSLTTLAQWGVLLDGHVLSVLPALFPRCSSTNNKFLLAMMLINMSDIFKQNLTNLPILNKIFE